ncbi:hypothetical protein FA15DRAFT_707174 [Coprinopsis marcescibilis]|uniref:Deoxyribonuclease NucA/NucB domain-containing protein n=1 Tax=Coprinopsis marcescibilis TaxID=230819 RepID=A0A5C3KN81_COPMA|nr:hypothetical protein FA15DRAFT_707174 [Coprinopsis marcescibilis]
MLPARIELLWRYMLLFHRHMRTAWLHQNYPRINPSSLESLIYNDQQLLRNMCDGMGGENAVTLTYSGKLTASAKKRKRQSRSTGCAGGLCRQRGQRGLNSCGEVGSPELFEFELADTTAQFPPALSDESGSAFSSLTRVVNCMPGVQNVRQGQLLSNMVKAAGIVAGQTFAISIDCEKVQDDFTPSPGGEPVNPSNTTNEENFFPADPAFNETTNTMIIYLGDLVAGRYTVNFRVVSGLIERGGYIIDNMGDEIIPLPSSYSGGSSDQVSFDIEPDGELMGVGLVLPTRNRDAGGVQVSWEFNSEPLPPSVTRTGPSQPGSGARSGDEPALQLGAREALIATITLLLVAL